MMSKFFKRLGEVTLGVRVSYDCEVLRGVER